MAKLTKRTKGALWLLIAPTAGIITAFVLFAIVNLIFNPTMWMTPDGELPAATPIFISIINVLLFIIGTIGVIAWFPGIIAGIVLLINQKRDHEKA